MITQQDAPNPKSWRPGKPVIFPYGPGWCCKVTAESKKTWYSVAPRGAYEWAKTLDDDRALLRDVTTHNFANPPLLLAI